MTSKKKDDIIFDVEERINHIENYYEEHKKPIITGASVVVAIILAVVAFEFWYLPSQEQEAEDQMYHAQMYFSHDSINKAIHGDATATGFEAIADQYNWTPAGQLANYYLGLCYYDKKEYQKSIDYLGKFDAGDVLVSSNAVGVMGDAELQLGHKDQALQDYLDAVKRNNNTLTSPVYLKKAALVCELMGDYAQATNLYQRIKTEYHTSLEAQDIDKYLYRAKAKSGTLEN